MFESFEDDAQFEVQVIFPYEDELKVKQMKGLVTNAADEDELDWREEQAERNYESLKQKVLGRTNSSVLKWQLASQTDKNFI